MQDNIIPNISENIHINIFEEISEEELDNFLNKNNTEHKIYHTYSYKKFIEEAFGIKYQFIAAKDENNNIITILPIVKIKSKIFGNKLISSAYIEYGGFSGSSEGILPILNFLKEKNSFDYEYLEIRGGMEEQDEELSKHLIKKDLYKRFVLLLRNEKDIWNNIQKSKRKAIKKSLNLVEVKDVSFDDIDMLYNLYCKNMHRFGSPPYSKKYFVSFYDNLVKNNLGKILGAYYQGKLVAALLGFTYKDRVHILIAVSDDKYQELRPNDAVHWNFIKWSCENNYRYFDFGRVREESGQFEYKQKWGPEIKDLPSYFTLWNGKDIPFVDPEKHQFLVNVWKKLPLFVTKVIGMKIRKELGI